MRGVRRWLKRGIIAAVASVALLAIATLISMHSPPESLRALTTGASHQQMLDRRGEPLNVTYQNRWNLHQQFALHEMPEFLVHAFIESEDKRFYAHGGIDWRARASALMSNIKHGHAVRGASTLTEQIARMIHPRPRTVWARWLEGFEAQSLERAFNKDELLEFYLNQVPYAANRRGVAQAARYYFNRDLGTLNKKEMLALVVLVRAPSRMDLWQDTSAVEAATKRLSDRLIASGHLSEAERDAIVAAPFSLELPELTIVAPQWVHYLRRHPLRDEAGKNSLRSTLDGRLQTQAQQLLDERIRSLKHKKLHNGAVMVADHTTGDILVWAVAGKGRNNQIDAVLAPRQPGSALKPFVYAEALGKGWSAATVIDDAPLSEMVGAGIHQYRNYSNQFYGPITLREALGNSLNIPAVKTLHFVGTAHYLERLKAWGFTSLTRPPDIYGDGLALGNGEVSLFEMVQAYAALANGGRFRPLKAFQSQHERAPAQAVISPEVASLMGNILSDSYARRLEFGGHGVLNLPVQTAVKTGTSTDYRDAWAIGYNDRYVVGIWMGNLDQTPTDGITGSTGPALLLRSVFAELNRFRDTRGLALHRGLQRHDICMTTKRVKRTDETCDSYSEWFVPGTEPHESQLAETPDTTIRLRRPTEGLLMAYDPRIPPESQAMPFQIQGITESDRVEWQINDQSITTTGADYLWPVARGTHKVSATIWRGDETLAHIPEVSFRVK